MSREALEHLRDLAVKGMEPRQLIFQDKPYSNTGLLPIKESCPEPIKTNTLESVVDYITGSDYETKETGSEQLIIHIASPGKVNVHSKIVGPFNQRFFYLSAVAVTPDFGFGIRHEIEDFTIQLQSCFDVTEDRGKLLSMLGNIKDEHTKTYGDDGISQSVTVKDGIDLRKEVVVPNPVYLRPFRTFPEIDQPESRFIFRMHQQKGNPPLCSLTEADGGLWKLKAIMDIKRFITGKLSDQVVEILA